ncbi:MAG: ABC transporter permease, partial [Ruminococcus sp.]|nr:ABC transporter permease [Ruminococcus sp.]
YIHDNHISYYAECREAERDSIYGLYGGLFFLGIFLSVLFTIAAVLIIYYKQISEGYDDKNRFEIMQKVGMTEQEVKKSIHSQVLTVFFLPLVTAGIHTAFAFPLIKKILAMLQLNNTKLYAICTIVSLLIFALIYGIIYLLTAKVYYKIVKK